MYIFVNVREFFSLLFVQTYGKYIWEDVYLENTFLKGREGMPIAYKMDIIEALKKHGYNTNRIRKEKLLAEGVLQSLREGKAISFQNVDKICDLLECEPGDILVKVDENGRDAEGFLHLNYKQGIKRNKI